MIEHFVARQDPRCSEDCEYSTWPVRNPLPILLRTYLKSGTASPLVSTWCHSHEKCSQALPIFAARLPLCIIVNTNQRKKGGGPGTRLTTLASLLHSNAKNNLLTYLSIYLYFCIYTSAERWLNLQSRTSTSIGQLSCDLGEGSWLVGSELAVAKVYTKDTQK